MFTCKRTQEHTGICTLLLLQAVTFKIISILFKYCVMRLYDCTTQRIKHASIPDTKDLFGIRCLLRWSPQKHARKTEDRIAFYASAIAKPLGYQTTFIFFFFTSRHDSLSMINYNKKTNINCGLNVCYTYIGTSH